jgi:hypothetical protein
MSKYDVAAIRQKLKQTMSGKFSDPDEFKPAKATSDKEPIKYRFFILPPLYEGDELKTGTSTVVKKGMDQFFIAHANHWIKDQPYPCPRVWSGAKCKICNFGFDLLKEENNKDEEKRRKIIREWMPTTYHMVNIYFTNWSGNPEELRGTVKYFNASKTLIDQWTAALMRDDAGDPEDPQVHGLFFDENAAFVFELQVLKQGKQNSYKTSKFIANNGVAMPMIKNEDGDPDEAKLAKLLKLRHNLWDKIKAPDLNEISKVFSAIVDGDDGDDGGFDEDETRDKRSDRKPEDKKSRDEDDDNPKPRARKPEANVLKEDDDEKPSKKRSSSLDDEMPLDDDDPKPRSKKVEEKPKKTVSKVDEDDDDGINDLLSQLDED